ncbi:MAG: peptidase M15 [Flavobacteriaceae bacterium]|nr:peptidase M15 [Flavobacteriaceae bacterium]|tara:strand:+ start:6194 stop:6868 length:675 start_codon:yes stop_codon:yes gene_type:complete
MRTPLLFLLFVCGYLKSQKIPPGFIELKKAVPDLVIDLRYATSENFIGTPVDGYGSKKAVGTIEMAESIRKSQNVLKSYGLGIKVYDAYRPQKAVNHFIRWSKVQDDTINKMTYYPELKKSLLFELGFISAKSGHSRGSTIDLTLIYLEGENKGKEVDMGGSWDFFGDASHYNFLELSEDQKYYRKLLRKTLLSFGFIPYEKEWWHFTLKKEPFPNTYFDFIVP